MQYRSSVPIFLGRFLDEPIEALNHAQLLERLAHYRRTHAKASTYATLAMIKAFSRWLHREGLSAVDHVQRLRTVPPRQILPRVITYRQVQEMMASLGRLSPFDTRDRAMIGLSFAALLRSEQLLNRRLADYDDSLHTPGLFLEAHKRGNSHLARIAGPSREAMTEYLYEARTQIIGDNADSGWLFVSGGGLRVRRESWSKRLQGIAWNVGIRTPIMPHTLRHSAATFHARKGENAFSISEMLGHATTRSAMTYVHMASEDLDAIAERNLTDPRELFA